MRLIQAVIQTGAANTLATAIHVEPAILGSTHRLAGRLALGYGHALGEEGSAAVVDAHHSHCVRCLQLLVFYVWGWDKADNHCRTKLLLSQDKKAKRIKNITGEPNWRHKLVWNHGKCLNIFYLHASFGSSVMLAMFTLYQERLEKDWLMTLILLKNVTALFIISLMCTAGHKIAALTVTFS